MANFLGGGRDGDAAIGRGRSLFDAGGFVAWRKLGRRRRWGFRRVRRATQEGSSRRGFCVEVSAIESAIPDNHWIQTGSQVMIVGAAAKTMAAGYQRSADADPTKPYVMWPGARMNTG
jgi:hypothetical protein